MHAMLARLTPTATAGALPRLAAAEPSMPSVTAAGAGSEAALDAYRASLGAAAAQLH